MGTVRGVCARAIASLIVVGMLAASAAFAQEMMDSVPKAPSNSSGTGGSSLMLSVPSVATPAPPPSSAPQMNNELTLPSLTSQQASMPKLPPSDTTKVIPVIPPDQDVLTLPQASRDFLGRWGGKLELENKFGPADVPQHAIVSLVFGERDGQVVLATTVFGSPDTQILKTSATAEGPSKVNLEIAGLDLSQQPPLRHVEKLTMELTSNNQLRCTKRVDLYASGFSQPLVEAEYAGTLGQLTNREDQMLSEEVMRKGVVPRARIEEGNPPPESSFQPSE
ncbi:MAG TPA: hypothetical protein VJX23_07945 [Candidatus Binataceae bacterium]|nr:hypothetical protein [Candidatus Binataceae bacterium]